MQRSRIGKVHVLCLSSAVHPSAWPGKWEGIFKTIQAVVPGRSACMAAAARVACRARVRIQVNWAVWPHQRVLGEADRLLGTYRWNDACVCERVLLRDHATLTSRAA
jgi:hypothetical protein